MWTDRVREVIKYAVIVGGVLAVAHLGSNFSCRRISSGFDSMPSTVTADSQIIVNRSQVRAKTFRVDDVVCFNTRRANKDLLLAAHVMALPGETIEIRGGSLYVNDKARPTTADGSIAGMTVPKLLVPAGYLLVGYETPIPSYRLQDMLVPVSRIEGVLHYVVLKGGAS